MNTNALRAASAALLLAALAAAAVAAPKVKESTYRATEILEGGCRFLIVDRSSNQPERPLQVVAFPDMAQPRTCTAQ